MLLPPKRIILSRTDNIGDVVLTLPMAGYLKSVWPETEIIFIGKKYTQPVIALSSFVDRFVDRDELVASPSALGTLEADAIVFIYPDKELARLAKKAGIPVRIGTSHRAFHWLYCNRLVHFSRNKSTFHESQLNFKLLKPLGFVPQINLSDMASFYGFKRPSFDQEKFKGLIDPTRFSLIFHPKSKGSAREWPLGNFKRLAQQLPADRFQVFITGSLDEGERIRAEAPDFFSHGNAIDVTGKFSLTEFIGFIGACDGMVACSTGPLHIAAALSKPIAGLYPPIRPMHPGRWKPVGEHVHLFSLNKTCNDCRKSTDCACIQAISVTQIEKSILTWSKHP